MIDQIGKLVIALIGGAIAAAIYTATDESVKVRTGQRIHQHIFEWWNEMRDEISSWLHKNHKNKNITWVVLRVLDAIDGYRVETQNTTNKITLGAVALTDKDENIIITERIVLKDELAQQFPELVEKPDLFIPATEMELTV